MKEKEFLKDFFNKISPSIPLSFLIKVSNQKVLLPFYHSISNKRLPHIINLYLLRDEKLFIKDLEYFCKHFKPIDSDELYQLKMKNQVSTKPVFHLTFDDGLKEIFTIVAPILKSKGIPASFFVNTDFIDNRGLFYRYKCSLLLEKINLFPPYPDVLVRAGLILGTNINTIENLKQKILDLQYHDTNVIDLLANLLEVDFRKFLLEESPYLSTDEIKSLQKEGFTIGAHSLDHPFFKLLSPEEQRLQIAQSLELLENRFNVKKKYFSFPFNDEGVPNKIFEWLYEVEECRLSFGISGLKSEKFPQHLHRLPMEGNHLPARTLIKQEYLYFMLKMPFGKNQIKRK